MTIALCVYVTMLYQRMGPPQGTTQSVVVWTPGEIYEYIGWRLGLRPNPPFVYFAPDIQKIVPESTILTDEPAAEGKIPHNPEQ